LPRMPRDRDARPARAAIAIAGLDDAKGFSPEAANGRSATSRPSWAARLLQWTAICFFELKNDAR